MKIWYSPLIAIVFFAVFSCNSKADKKDENSIKTVEKIPELKLTIDSTRVAAFYESYPKLSKFKSDVINLKEVIIDELPTTNLNFSGNPNLEILEVSLNTLYYSLYDSSAAINIDFSPSNSLKQLKVNIPYRTQSSFWVDIPRNISFNNLNEISTLEKIDLSFCNLIQPLIIDNSNNFHYFNAFRCIFNNNLSFGTLPSLNYLNIETPAAESNVANLATTDLTLDLSGCSILTSLDVHYPKLRFISLKNGIAQTIFGVDLSNDNQGLLICIDSFEQPLILSGQPFGWDVPTIHTFTSNCTLSLQENQLLNTIFVFRLFEITLFYLMNFLKSIEYNECPHPYSNGNRTRESTQCFVSYIKFKT